MSFPFYIYNYYFFFFILIINFPFRGNLISLSAGNRLAFSAEEAPVCLRTKKFACELPGTPKTSRESVCHRLELDISLI
jgi:hypothetical protein